MYAQYTRMSTQNKNTMGGMYGAVPCHMHHGKGDTATGGGHTDDGVAVGIPVGMSGIIE